VELYAFHLKAFMYNALQIIEKYKNKINTINVFPVSDGDTGTNIYLTLKKIWERIENLEINHVGNLLKHISEAAIENAQGNSGNILALFFYGLYEGLKDKEKITIKDLREAVKIANDYARSAVANPKEGTILSAMKAFYLSLKNNNDLTKSIKLGIKKGLRELKEKAKYIKELRENKVIDAGGLAFILMLKGWLKSLGEDIKISLDKYIKEIDKRKIGGYCINILAIVNEDIEKIKNILKKYDSLIIKKVGDKVKIHLHHNNIDEVIKIIEGLEVKVINVKYSEF